MIKHDCWPPPDWTEVIVLWQTMLDHADYSPNKIIAWVDQTPGGQYHLHGYKNKEGFAFRFKNPKDALLFKLRWSV